MFRFLTDQDVRSSLREHRCRLTIAVSAMVGRALLGLAAPFFMGKSVDVIVEQSSASDLTRYVILLITFAVGTAICQWWMRWLWIGWSRDAELSMRDGLFRHLVRMPMPFFHRNRTGDLMSRLTSDVEAVRMGYGPGVLHCTHPLIMTVGAVTLMLITSPVLTCVAMAPMVGLFLVMKTILPSIHQRATKVQERQADLTARAQESFSGARVIKAFAREAHEVNRFGDLSRAYLTDSLAHARRRGLFQCLIEVFAGIGNVVLFVFAARMVIHETLTVGDYVAFTGYLKQLIWPMIALGWTLALFKRAEAAEERIGHIRSEPPEDDDPGATQQEAAPDSSGALQVEDLTFTYDGAMTPSLQDISLRVDAGSTLGVVGSTASGKTTLLNLLLRLHQPPRGTIYLDGTDILDLSLTRLRGAFAVVPQECFLFSQTVRENISFGDQTLDDAAVEDAARVACLAEDLEHFPRGLDTMVGERGITLSGGQRQRTAIARALIRPGPILVLDDALSSVDTQTERRILERLRPLLDRRTAIIVSHRLSAVRHADQIVVLDEGRIVERGDHGELMDQGGTYARIWRLQQDQRELDEL